MDMLIGNLKLMKEILNNIEDILNEISRLNESINNRKILILDKTKTKKYIWHHERMMEYEYGKIRELEYQLSKLEK